MSTDKLTDPFASAKFPSTVPFMSQEQRAEFMRIVLDALGIERHYHLFLWLRGELQDLLPHETLISASGDFAKWAVKLDIVSANPELRTKQLAQFNIDPMIDAAHSQWVNAGRRPILLNCEEACAALNESFPALHRALGAMESIFVHGVHDFRDGHDSVYIMYRAESLNDDVRRRRFSLLDLLVPQIDTAFRRVESLPLAASKGKEHGEDRLNLSAREQEILDLICRGETNMDIARALDISPFTVKNHLQRIFKKIGVSNRTQAATKYNDALRELRKLLS